MAHLDVLIAQVLAPYRGRLPASDLAWMAEEIRRVAKIARRRFRSRVRAAIDRS